MITTETPATLGTCRRLSPRHGQDLNVVASVGVDEVVTEVHHQLGLAVLKSP